MTLVLFCVGAGSAALLVGLLAWTLIDDAFRIWPTPEAGSWQSIVFWTLFRAVNVLAFAVALTEPQQLLGLTGWLRASALVVLATAGLAYAFSLIALGKSNTYCSRDGLVTHGIYRWTRNPQYATVIPVYAALALATDGALTYIMCAGMITVYVLMALVEEPWLAAAYGNDYERYCRRVPRFFNGKRALVLAQALLRHVQRQLLPRLLEHQHNLLPQAASARKRLQRRSLQ